MAYDTSQLDAPFLCTATGLDCAQPYDCRIKGCKLERGAVTCDYIGKCAAPEGASGPVTNCVHCGKELRLRANGKWYTWDAPVNGGAPQDGA
jgi:hypothetical protein